MSSAAAVDDGVVSAFQELKQRKVNAVVYRLSDDLSEIFVDSKGTWTHDELLEGLPQDEPRYVVYDLPLTKGEGEGQHSKIILISWCPEDTRTKLRMIHSANFIPLKNMLDGVQKCLEATELSDVDYDGLVSRVN